MPPRSSKNMAETGPGRVVYVVGPSGAGKDTLLNGARMLLDACRNVHFIQREITRPPDPNGEDHQPVTEEQFEYRAALGLYALYWRAHGRAYGISAARLAELETGDTAVISGSRKSLDMARDVFSQCIVVHITAPRGILKARLLARGRETNEQINERLDRAATFPVDGDDVIEIVNLDDVDVGIARLAEVIKSFSP